jgi:hypothetical protein
MKNSLLIVNGGYIGNEPIMTNDDLPEPLMPIEFAERIYKPEDEGNLLLPPGINPDTKPCSDCD